MSQQHSEKETDPYTLLYGKLTAFQRDIVVLKQNITEQKDESHRREQDFLLDLLEIADAFDVLESNMVGKKDSLDKTGRRLVKNMKAIKRKLLRLLASRYIEPLELEGSHAQIGQCKVISTESDPDLVDETIISVQKKGYVDTVHDRILRKAEVVTVCNE